MTNLREIPAARRAVLLGVASFLPATLAGGVVPAGAQEGDDAQIVADCAAFDALERRLQSGGETDEVYDAIMDEQLPLLNSICSGKATTLQGLRAKASTMALYGVVGGCDPDAEGGYWNHRMVASLLRDMVGARSKDLPPLSRMHETDLSGLCATATVPDDWKAKTPREVKLLEAFRDFPAAKQPAIWSYMNRCKEGVPLRENLRLTLVEMGHADPEAEAEKVLKQIGSTGDA